MNISKTLFLGMTMLFLQGCNTTQAPETVPETAPEVVGEAAVEKVQEVDSEAQIEGATTISIETELGTMQAVLYDSTPLHRDNFVKLVTEGFYDDLLFHRVIDGFMIQGGDPQSRGADAGKRLGTGGPGYLIDAEIGEPHFKGTLAAARTGGGGNPLKKSSGSQFYIVQGTAQTEAGLTQFEAQKGITYTPEQKQKYLEIGGTPMLDADYTVFGEVTIGLDIIDKIADVETGASDRPTEDVTMKITLTEGNE